MYNLYSNFSTSSAPAASFEPKSFVEKILCAREKLETLIDNTINHVREFILSTVDNDAHDFKEILMQTDRADFTQAMEKEIDAHKRRGHWEMCK